MYTGEKGLYQSTASIGGSHQSFWLSSLSSRCIYSLILSHCSTVSGSARRYVPNPNSPGSFSCHCFTTDLIQSSNTSLNHKYQQRVGKLPENSAQDCFLWCAVHGRERRQSLCKSITVQESMKSITQLKEWLPRGGITWAMTSEMEAHPTRKLYLCFSRIPAWVHAWKKKAEQNVWLWYLLRISGPRMMFFIQKTYKAFLHQQHLVWTWANVKQVGQRKHYCI